jgi:hypothetical protein
MENPEPAPSGGRACLHCGEAIPAGKDRRAIYCDQRCQANASHARWRKNNIDTCAERKREWRKANPDGEKKAREKLKADKVAKTGRGIHSQKVAMLNAARQRAIKDGLPFNLTIEDLHIPDRCPVLGLELLLGGGIAERDQAPSLDKVIPALGYTKNNVIVVSVRANRAKNNLAIHELQALASFYTNLVSSGGWMLPQTRKSRT